MSYSKCCFFKSWTYSKCIKKDSWTYSKCNLKKIRGHIVNVFSKNAWTYSKIPGNVEVVLVFKGDL